MLEQFFTKVDDTEMENATCVFQQDGTLSYFSLQVYLTLNASFQISGLEEVGP